MLIQFFVLFNIGIYLSAVVPYLLVSEVPYPPSAIPYGEFLTEDMLYFVDCLPIVAAQYLISLRFRNFLIPVGVGFMTWVAALASLPWRFGFTIPYTYTMLNYLKHDGGAKAVMPAVNIHAWAIGYLLVFTAVGFCSFVTKREKG
jgi:hypothetical protein